MTERITNENIASALKHYSNALNAVGFDHDPEQLRVEAPYGQVWYVLRRDDEGRIHHDLPGFTGSGGSGFVKRRDLHITLLHIASAFFDLRQAQDMQVKARDRAASRAERLNER